MFSRKKKDPQDGAGSEREPADRPKQVLYSTRGVYGLKKCHDPKDAIADIVFVHGLTGNRESTWTWTGHGSSVFWPAHLLKNDVPSTRIVTFGYDADIAHFWSMSSNNRIGNHALNLVNALSQMRERTQTEDRPIIFVTHSLGGLVFEDAMLSSRNSAEPHVQSLFDCTMGVCFLGTPHCGANAANWASIFGSIVDVVKTTNTSLLNVLRPESEVLARIQGDFHAMLRTCISQGRPALRITCFFEELGVRGVGEIVPKYSAILSGYNSIGIHANHMDMTKFSSDEDAGYLSVSTEILRWIREIQKASQQSAPSFQNASNPNPGYSQAQEETSPPITGYLEQYQQPQSASPYYPTSSHGAYNTPQLPQLQSPSPLGDGSPPRGHCSPLYMQQGPVALNIRSQTNSGNGKIVQGNSYQFSGSNDSTFNF